MLFLSKGSLYEAALTILPKLKSFRIIQQAVFIAEGFKLISICKQDFQHTNNESDLCCWCSEMLLYQLLRTALFLSF